MPHLHLTHPPPLPLLTHSSTFSNRFLSSLASHRRFTSTTLPRDLSNSILIQSLFRFFAPGLPLALLGRVLVVRVFLLGGFLSGLLLGGTEAAEAERGIYGEGSGRLGLEGGGVCYSAGVWNTLTHALEARSVALCRLRHTYGDVHRVHGPEGGFACEASPSQCNLSYRCLTKRSMPRCSATVLAGRRSLSTPHSELWLSSFLGCRTIASSSPHNSALHHLDRCLPQISSHFRNADSATMLLRAAGFQLTRLP